MEHAVKETMTRKAADNVYLHKDFHGALSTGIDYLDRTYGGEAVRDYLRRFTLAFYVPLIEEIRTRGLIALEEHFRGIYEQEGGQIRISRTEDEMILEIQACPAVMHMRGHGYHIATRWIETERTVNAALCEGTLFTAELLEYDEQTGRSVQRFTRRSP